MKRFIQITAGRGPEECCFVVAQVLRKIIKECKAHNCYHEVIHREPSHLNGNLRSAAISVHTKNCPTILLDWIGTIQWTAQSPIRPHHKRKNWFVGVFEIKEDQVGQFNPRDVTYETCRSGGPGGQHVNKVSSAVRATHSPTGLSVKAMDTRSQLQNKRLATERLELLWNAEQLNRIKAQQDDNWNNHLNLLRGNPIKIFKEKEFKQKQKPKKYRDKRNTEKQSWRKQL